MSKPIKLTLDGMRELIQDRAQHCKIVTIRAHTIPDMRKTDNPFYGKVIKDKKVNGEINWNYESAVNRQRAREDKETDFEAKPRRWGQRIVGTPFVVHGDKVYIELKGERTLEEIYRDIVTGEPMPNQEIVRQYVKNPWNPAEYQGIDKGVYLRDYTLSNLREIRIGGDLFELVVDENSQL